MSLGCLGPLAHLLTHCLTPSHSEAADGGIADAAPTTATPAPSTSPTSVPTAYCDPGMGVDVDVSSNCQVCASGRVSAGGHNIACSECPLGEFPNDDQTECRVCGAGMETSSDYTGCDECTAGRYSDGVWMKGCSDCEVGLYNE